jgi:hypothetical protein
LRSTLLASVLACAAALPPATADAAEPTAAEKETARTMHTSGDKKFEQGDYRGALADYKAADLIMGVPSTRAAVAQAQEKLGLLVEALDSALAVGRIPKRTPEPEVFEKARAKAQALAASLRGRIPSVKFALQGVPEGRAVDVSIDGSNVPMALLAVPRKVNPGKHRIKASLDGYRPFEQEVQIAEGRVTEVPIRLEPMEGASAPAPAPATPPGTTAPPPPAKPVPAEPPPDQTEPEPSGGISPLVWIGFGVGGAGLILGGITGGIAAGKASDLQDRCPDNQCPRSETEDDYDSAYTMAHVSTAGFIIGGVGVAVGVVGLLLPSGEAETTTGAVTLRPIVGPGYAGLAGSF